MASQQLPRAVENGDAVALIAPASWSEPLQVEETEALVRSWGLHTRLGAHVGERRGYLAGPDAARAADLNSAIRNPDIRAIITLRGGCGSFRLVRELDLDALRSDPKPLVGFSDITALHHVWHTQGVPSLHGAAAGRHPDLVDQLLRGGTPDPIRIDPNQYGSELTTRGRATGPLFGGNLEMLARSVGVLDFDLGGHILLLEINRSAGLGHVDRALTQLILSGAVEGIVGIAIGWLAGFEDYADRGWTVLDVLKDRLAFLDVPILAGLPFGHDDDMRVATLGVECTIDADHGLWVGSAVTASEQVVTPGLAGRLSTAMVNRGH